MVLHHPVLFLIVYLLRNPRYLTDAICHSLFFITLDCGLESLFFVLCISWKLTDGLKTLMRHIFSPVGKTRLWGFCYEEAYYDCKPGFLWCCGCLSPGPASFISLPNDCIDLPSTYTLEYFLKNASLYPDLAPWLCCSHRRKIKCLIVFLSNLVFY